MAHLDYDEFVAKFATKKTTDDCYTPPEVYEVVRSYVDTNITPLGGRNIVRPFFPGGDYENVEYKEGDIVLDNPPFSFLAKIIDFFLRRRIPFFLFAPHLTLFGYCKRKNVTAVVCGATVTYENGAKVATSFITNIYPDSPAFVVEGRLYRMIQALEHKDNGRQVAFCRNLVNSARLGKVAKKGQVIVVPRESAYWLRKTNLDYVIYGSGFLVSDNIADQLESVESVVKSVESVVKSVESVFLDSNEKRIIAGLK